MKANTRIGEVAIHAEIDGEGRSYLLRPSFFAMSQLEDPDWYFNKCRFANAVMKMGAYYCGADDIDHPTLNACIKVIEACATDDLPDSLLGYFYVNERRGKLIYKTGAIGKLQIVSLAWHLMRWGLIGKPSDAWLRLPKKKGQKQKPFDISEFVGKAMSSLKMSRDDAWSLTMTEFQRAMEQEHPIDESKLPVPENEAEEAVQVAREAQERRKAMNIKPRSGKLSDISKAIRGE